VALVRSGENRRTSSDNAAARLTAKVKEVDERLLGNDRHDLGGPSGLMVHPGDVGWSGHAEPIDNASSESNSEPTISAALSASGVLGDDGRYKILFEANPKPMWVFDAASLQFLEVNAAAVASYGYPRDELLTMRVVDICSADDAAALMSDVAIRPGAPAQAQLWHRVKKNGDTTVVRVNSVPVVFGGRAARLLSADDVTHEVATNVALRDSEAQLRAAQEMAHVGSWKWTIRGDLLSWSAELAAIFGVTIDRAPRTFGGYLGLVHPDDRDAACAIVKNAMAEGLGFNAEYRIVRPDGEQRWLRSRGRVEADESGRGSRLLGVCQDITNEKLAEQNLIRQALHDPLTGFANRALLLDHLAKALARLNRNDTIVAVLCIDLDRFKLVNDRMGHGAGDEVLITVAERLQDIVRPSDTVARLGGDEFIILCEDLVGDADAIAVAERVLERLAEPMELQHGRSATTGASIGVVLAADATTTTEALLRDADAAMYKAKQAGRNRYMVFDNEFRTKSIARSQQADELRRGLERAEFRVLYQPVIDLRLDTWSGVEALVRWEHPRQGLLLPSDFIGVAEEAGSIVPLGEWVLGEACREAVRRQTFPGQRPLLMAVNLSARQLTQASLIDALGQALAETGLDPSQLCLEITESALMEDVELSVEALLALKALGVRIAVDDFGTGYSSLSYLRHLPVDIVKIDRSFVAGVGIDPADDAIVASVANLSHALGLRVVAEGVETQEQLIAVRALGCDQAQGYYWSRPVSADQLGPWAAALGSSSASAEPVDLYGLLVDRTEALRAATGRPVVLQAPRRLAAAVADLSAVKTILDHLLGNAVVYSGVERPVVVSAAGDRHWVRVSVTDFGVGMTDEELARCFEQFWQADGLGTARHPGTGIGLYIVRSLVEAMGGHVGAKSAPGKGSTFTFALPRSARAVVRRRPAHGLHTDVSEDSTIREFMRQIGVPSRAGS